MVTVGMYYDVLANKEQIFEESVEKVIGVLADNPGRLQSYLYHRVKEPNLYATIPEWSSRDEFTAFGQSAVFKQVADWGKAEILARRPSHKVYGRERDLR